MKPKRNIHKFANNKVIVDQLRRLPTPNVPEGLEDRLIAGMPRPVPGKSQWFQWQVLAGLSAVAAVAVLLAVLFEPTHSMKDFGSGSPNDNRNVVGAWPALSLNPQETDPCNVLPPLGDWR